MTTMTRTLAGMIALLIGSAAFAQDTELTWKRHTSENGRFSILFPGTPKEQKQQTDSPLGKLNVYSLMVEPNAKLAYLVSWNDYPAVIKDDDPQDVLARVRDGNNQFLKGKLIADKKLSIGKEKHPAREIEFEFPFMGDTFIYRANVMLVDNRLYQVVMIGSKEVTHSDAADDYFRSLKLLPKKPVVCGVEDE